MTRVLVFSTLFPNTEQPNHGVFVENRLRATVDLGGIDATVLAPVPYFPFSGRLFGRYGQFARVPRREVRHGIDVLHPRYLVAPRFGRWTPETLYRVALAAVRRLEHEGRSFDVIDAHYFYPDGVAAARLGETLGLPVVITGRGSDLTLFPTATRPRALIQHAAQEASALVTVCDDLRQRLIDLGAPPARTLVLSNGVDLRLFNQGDRDVSRHALGLDGFTLLSVGSLIERKGHDLAIAALAECRDCTLLIAGGGPLRSQLESLARRLGVADRVRFLGDVPHDQLPDIYGAADVLVLASSREGWANVLLESMACGTPVLATDVNGTAEVVCSRAAGMLVSQRTVGCLVETLQRLRLGMPSRAATRAYAEGFGWRRIALANKVLLSGAGAAGYGRRFSPEIVGDARLNLAQTPLQLV